MQYFNSTWRSSVLIFMLLIAGLEAYSQVRVAAPYSRFGVGELQPGVFPAQRGMGGTGTFMIEGYKVNPTNPASYAYLLDPVFSAGVNYKIQNLKSSEETLELRYGRPYNFSLGLPLKRGKWGMAFGIMPYSTAGYDLTVDNTDLEDPHTLRYEGDGGINRAFVGMGYRIINKVDSALNATSLSIGAEAGYHFGSLNYSSRTEFDFRSNSLSKRFQNFRQYKAVRGKFGVNYQTNLLKRTKQDPSYLKLLAGATFSAERDMKTIFRELGETYQPNSVGTEIARDTLIDTGEIEGTTTLPFTFTLGGGLDYVSTQKFRIQGGVEYSYGDWSSYKTSAPGFNDQGENLKNSQEISIGVEVTPDLSSIQYFEKVEYRVGFRYSDGYLRVRDQDITESGISFGLSLPINAKRNLSRSMFNIGVEYGTRGTTDNSLIEEEYWNFQVGFTLTPHVRNLWLKQRKYD